LNDIPYKEVEELTNFPTVQTYVHSGWLILEIYKRKRQIPHTKEFEEYAVYVVGNPEGG
jgi:hypothetical protein